MPIERSCSAEPHWMVSKKEFIAFSSRRISPHAVSMSRVSKSSSTLTCRMMRATMSTASDAQDAPVAKAAPSLLQLRTKRGASVISSDSSAHQSTGVCILPCHPRHTCRPPISRGSSIARAVGVVAVADVVPGSFDPEGGSDNWYNRCMPHYFYVARCKDDSLYAGTCMDLSEREKKHN